MTSISRGKVVAIIQARLGSTRLPGKVLRDMGGETMLSRVVRRTQRAVQVDQVVVATTTEARDARILEAAKQLGVAAFAGSEHDVLDRYYRAAHEWGAERVVRITSDCPLIDPDLIDQVVETHARERSDYASNALEPSYPRGLDVEVMTTSALTRAWQNADQDYQRIHVTPYLYENPELFRIRSITHPQPLPPHRWTVDTPADEELVRAIFSRFDNQDEFGWRDVLALLDREPGLMELNQHVQQKSIEEG